jgi:hypothetical protein
MGHGKSRQKTTKARIANTQPDDCWCGICGNWIHRDILAEHNESKHGIAPKTSIAPDRPISSKSNSQLGRSVVEGRPRIKKNSVGDPADRFPEPLYEGQPRYEGGIRWEQGGSPGLGKRR